MDTLSSRRSLITAALTTAALALPALTQAGSTWHNMSGVACGAFNNSQADRLERSHVRIFNPGNNPLWVVCPLQRVAEDVASSGNSPQVRVTPFFSAMSAPGSSVRCIFREFDFLTTHEVGDGAGPGTKGIINVANFNIARPAVVPGAVTDFRTLATNDVTNLNNYSFACLLPRGTGINEIDVLQR